MTLWKVALIFADREGNERQTSLHTSSAATVAELVSFAQGLESALAPLSNARIVTGTISHNWRYSPLPAPSTSNVARKGLLIARDFEDPSVYDSFIIPSPHSVSGQYPYWNNSALPRPPEWRTPTRLINGRWARTGNIWEGRASAVADFFSHAATIFNLLDMMCRADGSEFPANDFLYAELHH